MNTFIFTTSPFPPVYNILQLFNESTVYIEAHENYQKRSLRNKYIVVDSTGVKTLSIPLTKGKNNNCKIKDVKIAYHEDWIGQHLKTLEAAYNASPFFHHYLDDIRTIYQEKHEFLWTFNKASADFVRKALDIPNGMLETENFQRGPSIDTDFRFENWPSIFNVSLKSRYRSVFDLTEEQKHKPISILDLLFCRGPETKSILWNYSKMNYGHH